MPYVLIGVGVLLVILATGNGGGARRLTKADIPRLSTLTMLKAGMGRELRACMDDQARKGARGTWIGVIGGAFAGLATFNPATALKVARTMENVWNTAFPVGSACRAAAEKLQRDRALHDQISKELGLPLDLSLADLQVITDSLGGFGELNQQRRDALYERCVKLYGTAYCPPKDGNG